MFGRNTFYLSSNPDTFADSEYRYQIDCPVINVEGKNGNQHTWFVNSEYWSEKINVPSIIFGKYVGSRLGCATFFDKEKTCVGWKGKYSNETIIEHLTDFVHNIILCPNCDLPELDMSMRTKKILGQYCKACGFAGDIEYNGQNARWHKTYELIEKHLSK